MTNHVSVQEINVKLATNKDWINFAESSKKVKVHQQQPEGDRNKNSK